MKSWGMWASRDTCIPNGPRSNKAEPPGPVLACESARRRNEAVSVGAVSCVGALPARTRQTPPTHSQCTPLGASRSSPPEARLPRRPPPPARGAHHKSASSACASLCRRPSTMTPPASVRLPPQKHV
eukprot:scaffold7530_cov74-Phaeocystis_antarctica.AAC.4